MEQSGGKSCVVEILGCQDYQVTSCDCSPSEMAHPQWGCWRHRGTVQGLQILAYDCVEDEGVRIAAHIVDKMLEACSQGVKDQLLAAGARLGGWPRGRTAQAANLWNYTVSIQTAVTIDTQTDHFTMERNEVKSPSAAECSDPLSGSGPSPGGTSYTLTSL